MSFLDMLHSWGISDAGLIGTIAFLVSVFIDWRPEFKWSPWRSLIKFLGTQFNSAIDKKMDTVRDEIQVLNEKIDNVQTQLSDHITESEIKSLQDTRRDILEFCNSCMNDRKHTREQFRFVLKQCDQYEEYIEKNNLKNGEITDAIHEIRRLHTKCIQENSFLKEGEVSSHD